MRASQNVNCNTKGGCTINVMYSNSISLSFSSGVNILEQSAVRANAGINITTVSNKTNGYSFHLSKGEKGYIGFTPYMQASKGILYTYSNRAATKSKNVEAYSARYDNGYAMGEYKIVYYK